MALRKVQGHHRGLIWKRYVWYAIPAGLVGARLYYVVQQPLGQYIQEPWRIFAFWEGGMAFYGAVFAVVLVVVLLARRMGISVWNFLDVTAIFAVVGQFFGRIGNLINGDIIGYPTHPPVGGYICQPKFLRSPSRHRLPARGGL